MSSSEEAMRESSLDNGHRVGNFHNYYEFNPADNRLGTMEKCGILKFIIDSAKRNTSMASRSNEKRDVNVKNLIPGENHQDNGNGNGAKVNVNVSDMEKREAKRRKRDHDEDKDDQLQVYASQPNGSKSESNRENCWLYCDLGCNEGDLTLAVAHTVASACSEFKSSSSSREGNEDDNPSSFFVHCLGLDIDQELIERAQLKRIGRNCTGVIDRSSSIACDIDEKDVEERVPLSTPIPCSTGIQPSENESHQSNTQTEAGVTAFHTCNLNDEKDHLAKSKSFLEQFGKKRFHLTSIFSTTMWIHIHGGDVGLVEFLERAADMTDYLLLEPQPSKCYRSVNLRLRRMNRPELDVSTERLKMRSNIETEVDRVLKRCGFERVLLSSDITQTNKDGNEQGSKVANDQQSRTKWNRNLQLYKRR